MYCAEQSKREAEYKHKARMRALKNVRKSTLVLAFFKGESMWDIARRYRIELSDFENAVRAFSNRKKR